MFIIFYETPDMNTIDERENWMDEKDRKRLRVRERKRSQRLEKFKIREKEQSEILERNKAQVQRELDEARRQIELDEARVVVVPDEEVPVEVPVEVPDVVPDVVEVPFKVPNSVLQKLQNILNIQKHHNNFFIYHCKICLNEIYNDKYWSKLSILSKKEKRKRVQQYLSGMKIEDKNRLYNNICCRILEKTLNNVRFREIILKV